MEPDWDALATAVRARRTELGLSQAAVQAAGGPSEIVLSRIESNTQPRPRADTLHKLDIALAWRRGTSLAITSGASGPPESIVLPDMRPTRIHVRGGDGIWREVDPNKERAAIHPESLRLSAMAEEYAALVSQILALSPTFSPEERDRLQHICTEIRRLPELLDPWMDTYLGQDQFLGRLMTYISEARDIMRTAAGAPAAANDSQLQQ